MSIVGAVTLTQAQAQLDAYLAAERAVLGGQAYEIAGRLLKRANLAEIQAGIQTWSATVQQLSRRARGGRRCASPIPGF